MFVTQPNTGNAVQAPGPGDSGYGTEFVLHGCWASGQQSPEIPSLLNSAAYGIVSDDAGVMDMATKVLCMELHRAMLGFQCFPIFGRTAQK